MTPILLDPYRFAEVGPFGGHATLTDNLESYWKLDEESGVRYDSVIATGNDLTDNNTVLFDTGVIGNAADCELGEYFSHANNESLSTGDIDFAFATWVKFRSFPDTYMPIITKWGGLGNEYILDIDNPTDRLRFVTNGSVRATTFGALSTATWYFVYGYHDSVANEVGISVNDGTVDTAATSGPAASGGTVFYLGRRTAPSYYYDGLIDETGFWKNRILSSGEVTDLYNLGSGLTY